VLKEKGQIFLTILVIIDIFFLVGAYLMAHRLSSADGGFLPDNPREIIVSSIVIIVFFIVLERFEYSHNYRFKPLRRILRDSVYFAFFITAVLYLVTLFKIYTYSNKFVFYYLAISFSVLLAERLGLKLILLYFRSRGYNFRRYLVIGADDVGLNFYRMTLTSPELGIKVVGFLDDNEELLTTDKPEYTRQIKGLILGKVKKLEQLINTMLIDNVIIALPVNAQRKIYKIANICEKHGIKAELLPDYFMITSPRPSVRDINGFPLIGIRKVPLENMFNRFIKRLFDIVVSLAGLVLTWPLFIIIIIAIKVTSRGPAFFKQERTGYNQKTFSILKFRTMKINEDADTVQATMDDPRKTGLGSLLRKSNLDELPQLINILRGEMSVIGPRPHMLAHTEQFFKKYDKYLVRHWVKPGLTGWAQVNGWRGDSDIGMRVQFDIDYIENWSLFFDAKILILTFFSSKVKENAH
jgi:Undecaprenyl-phosphate glucose phosphotransferase